MQAREPIEAGVESQHGPSAWLLTRLAPRVSGTGTAFPINSVGNWLSIKKRKKLDPYLA